MADTIVIQSAAVTIDDCESVIIVPEIAVEEPGYINSLTIKNSAHAKHEFHAMAQMAYFQFQDDELSIEEIESSLNVVLGTQNIELSGGMILCRNLSGEFRVLIHATQDRKKLLEAAYRYCTRWVRLDI
ncbi:MAG: hypothetical protein GQ542_08010 [Desulforhopalus sp.]|nr:hypothetical protein [Desulforhopalus sp.]